MTTKEVSLQITDMTCAACLSRVEKVLNKNESIKAEVNLVTEKAIINYDTEKLSEKDLIEKIEIIGYGVREERIEYKLTDMTCDACSSLLDKVLDKTEGISSATVNL